MAQVILPKPDVPIARGMLIEKPWYQLLSGVADQVNSTTLSLSGTAAAAIVGTVGTTDNRLVRADGAGGKTAQGSAVTCDDSGNLSGLGTLNGNPVFATASAADYQADTAGDLALTPAEVWNAAAFVALVDAASITLDLSTGINFSVTIAGNRTIANPTNTTVGKSGMFKVTASGATRTIDFGTNFKTTAGVATFPVSITSGKICYISYFVADSTNIIITGVLNNPA